MDSDNYTINPSTGRLIKKGSKLHLKLVKEAINKRDTKKGKAEFKLAESDSEEETPKKRYVPNPLPSRKKIAVKLVKHKKSVQKSDIDTMDESELSELESYIQKKLNKCHLSSAQETTEAESSEAGDYTDSE
jgi:hypothetical protein